MKLLNNTKWFVALIVLSCCFYNCSQIRTELFRNETLYLYRQGNVAYQSGSYDEAEDFYTRVIKLDPGYACAHVGLGNIAVLNRNCRKARRYYQMAVKVEPQLKPEVMARMSEVAIAGEDASLKNVIIDGQWICRSMAVEQSVSLDKPLREDIPHDFLFKSNGSMPPIDRVACLDRIEKQVRAGAGSAAFMFFAGTVLSLYDNREYPAIIAFKKVAASGDSEQKQKAYLAMADLYDRIADKDKAVEAYLKAVSAGVPIETVAAELAERYGVPVEVIIKGKSQGP